MLRGQPGLADRSDRSAAPPTVGHVLLSRQVVSSRARQTGVRGAAVALPPAKWGGRRPRQEKPRHLPETGDVPRSPRSHLPRCCNQTPGHSRMQRPPPSREAVAEPRNQRVCCFPTLKLWAGLALRPPGAGPASGSWAPAFSFMQRPPPCASGSRVVTPGSSAWALSCPGPASDRPCSPVPSLPLLPIGCLGCSCFKLSQSPLLLSTLGLVILWGHKESDTSK